MLDLRRNRATPCESALLHIRYFHTLTHNKYNKYHITRHASRCGIFCPLLQSDGGSGGRKERFQCSSGSCGLDISSGDATLPLPLPEQVIVASDLNLGVQLAQIESLLGVARREKVREESLDEAED